MAASRGHQRTLDLLLAAGAQAEAKTDDGISALHAAAHGRHSEATEILAKDLIQWRTVNDGVSAVLLSLKAAGLDEMTRKILHVWKGWSSQQALTQAVRFGDAPTARALLDTNVPINEKDELGRTPLGKAVELGHTEVVKVLLDAGAHCNELTPDIRTAWNVAFRNHHYDVVELLSDTRSRAKQPPIVSNADLLSAAIRGDMKAVSFQLTAGRSSDIFRNFWRKPLIAAQKAGRRTVVAYILQEMWTDPTHDRDQLGRLRNHVAAACGLQSSLKATPELFVNATDKQLWTPLHWAAYFGQDDMCQFLVRDGANIGAKDWQGWIPAQVARYAGYSDLAASLRPHRFSLLATSGLVSRGSHCDTEWHCDACSKVSPSYFFLVLTQFHDAMCKSNLTHRSTGKPSNTTVLLDLLRRGT
jgi:ankyrin repeat protein